MPWQKKSKPRKKAERVVKHKLPDGTIKEYRYAAYEAKPSLRRADNLSSMIDAYKDSPEWRRMKPVTKETYSLYLRPLDKIGGIDPTTLRRRDVMEIRDAISSSSGNGAANYFVTVTRQLFKWAIDRERVEINPASRIDKLETGHLPAWTQDQADIALRYLPEHLRRVVVLGMHTGQRRGDLCSMGWSAYDGQRIRLTQQKTDKPLVVPVHPDLKVELDSWRMRRTAAATTILTDHNGLPWTPRNLSTNMPNALRRIILPDGSKLPEHLNIHGLRKLAATNLAEAGCSTKEIAAVTGHETLAMVELYTKSADQERLATAAIHRLQTSNKNTKTQKTA